jgi:2-haloacid dehalogenase
MAPYDGVLFDLFSGVLNSQPAYDEVAGSASLGSRWRSEHSRLSYLAGDYRPHDDLVAEAAERIGLSPDRASALVAGWVSSDPGRKRRPFWPNYAQP